MGQLASGEVLDLIYTKEEYEKKTDKYHFALKIALI